MTTQTVDYKAKAFQPRNLVLFFLVVFGLRALADWLELSGAVKVSGEGLSALSAGPGVILLTLGAWGPLVAAFVVTAATEGRSGVSALWRRFWNRNVSIRWLLVTLLVYPVLGLAANLLSRALDGLDYPFLALPSPPWIYPLTFLGAFVFYGMAEEFGWRGYVLPRFQARWNALTSSLVLGVLWAAWHAAEFFLPGSNLYHKDPWAWALAIVAGSVLYTWVANHTKGSVLAAALLHASANAGIVWAMLDWRYVGLELLAVALVVILFGPKSLVRQRDTAERAGRVAGESLSPGPSGTMP